MCFKYKIIPDYQNDIVCKVYFLTVYEVFFTPKSIKGNDLQFLLFDSDLKTIES